MEELNINAGRRIYSRAGFAILLSLAVTLALQYVLMRLFSQYVQSDWLQYTLLLLPQYALAMPLAALLLLDIPSVPVIKKKLSIKRLAVVALICIAIMYAGNFIGNIINSILQSFVQRSMSDYVGDFFISNSVWSNVVFAVALGPVAEELFFRKLLIPRLLPFGEKPAVFFSSLAFGLIHGNLTQFFYAFGLGLAFGYIFVKTGKVRYTIMLHMFINFLGTIVAVYATGSDAAKWTYAAAIIWLAIAGCALFFANRRRIVMSRGLFGLPKGKAAVYLNAGALLFFMCCAAVFVFNTMAMFS